MRRDGSLSISIVIPVYRGAETLKPLVSELAALTEIGRTPGGRQFQVSEVLLVWDRGPDDSPAVIREITSEFAFARAIWLTRNFGQHAATLAGMTSSEGEWIVTLDEDGLHDPRAIPALLDAAHDEQALLVYATPLTPEPHPWWRRATSRGAKRIMGALAPGIPFSAFNSFRLIEGQVGRSAAAYTGPGAYLDVSLAWVTQDYAQVPVVMRPEGRPAGGYSPQRLAAHFGRLMLAAGTRPLLYVSWLGVLFFLLGVVTAVWVVSSLVAGAQAPTGWASVFVSLLLIGGLVLLALGVIAQYLRASTEAALGRPLYILGTDPARVFGE